MSRKPLIGIGADVACAPAARDRVFGYLTYVNAIRQSGAIPLIIPPQPENAADVVRELDGLLLAGGDDCDPEVYGEERHPSCSPMDVRRQENDISLARAARDHGVPTLGICLGAQVMNVAAGGKLIQDIASEKPDALVHSSDPMNRLRHEVTIEPGSRLAAILKTSGLNVNSSHHQSVRTPGTGLDVTAHAPDGIIEAIEDAGHPFYIGVQWHPEDMVKEESATGLFGAFVAAARRHFDTRQR